MPSAFPANPLGITVEVLLNGTWTNISQFVYQRSDIHIGSRGRPNETSGISPSDCTMTLNNRNGNFSPKNSGGLFYPYITRNVQVRISVNSQSANATAYSGYRFWGEISAWPPKWDSSGNDVYVEVTANGVLQRFAQGGNIGSPLKRFYLLKTGATAPVALWPMEENNGATQFVNAITTGDDLSWTGTPNLSSTSVFEGTDPLPLLNGAALTGLTGVFSVPSGSVTYSTPGTYSYVASQGVPLTSVEVTGGAGGGGFGVLNTASGSSGGSGEYAKETSVAVTDQGTYTLVVGAGGGGSNGTGAGGNGGNSTFTGDSVTVTAHGGTGGGDSAGTVGAKGTGSANTTHHDGAAGTLGTSGASVGGAGGPSSGGSAAAGNAGGSQSAGAGGAGGAAVTGGGAGGAGGSFGGCVDELTEIYTRRGWLTYDRLSAGDRTLAFNPASGNVEETAVTAVRVYEVPCAVTTVTHPDFTACVTSQHRWLVMSDGKWAYRETGELRDGDQVPLGTLDLIPWDDCTREESWHEGVTWCPTTEHGNWLARRNGTGYFLGNKP
jgi:hypothetical protein